MSKRVFLSFLVLLALFVVLLPSAAEASPSDATFYDYSTGRTLAGEPDIHVINKTYRQWAEWMYNYQQNPSSNPLHGGFSADVCPVCGAGIDYWHVDYISGNEPANPGSTTHRPYVGYSFNCSACHSSLTYKYFRVYDNIQDVVKWTGTFGSPYMGNMNSFIIGMMGLINKFASFIVANWLIFVLVVIPLIGFGLTLVISLIKKNK